MSRLPDIPHFQTHPNIVGLLAGPILYHFPQYPHLSPISHFNHCRILQIQNDWTYHRKCSMNSMIYPINHIIVSHSYHSYHSYPTGSVCMPKKWFAIYHQQKPHSCQHQSTIHTDPSWDMIMSLFLHG